MIKRKIIIDTDPGHDDAMAIMLAVKSNCFEIKAITTVCGNSTIENTTRNARYILGLLSQEKIPIYSGSSKPMKRPLIKAVVHGESGLEGIDPKNKPFLTNDAVDRIIEIVKLNPDKITLVTLGPLTNIAKAIVKDSITMNLLKEIIMMGGAIKVPGNKNRVAEFNFFVDPEAADIVFKSGIKKTIIPLDACNRVRLNLKDFGSIKNNKLRDVLLKMIKPYISNIYKDEGVKAALMYDPLTVYYSINSKACRKYRCNILIETKGILTRGMSVADFRKKPELKNNTTVVNYIDEKSFRKDFIKIISRK